jgi:hypothetical protein
MAARTTTAAAAAAGPTSQQTLSEIAYLTRALKAPTLRDSVERLAERARAEGWTHEQFLPTVCNGRCPPGNHMVVKDGSVPPGSRPAKPCRSSTSTTNAP